MDAGIRVGRRGSAVAVCRDSNGEFLGSSALIIAGVDDPATMEAIACREALCLAEDLHIIPFGVEYVIPRDNEDEEDTHSAATTEQMDEEIEVDADVSMPHETVQTPQLARLSEEMEEDVAIDGATTPVLHDEFWEAGHQIYPSPLPSH